MKVSSFVRAGGGIFDVAERNAEHGRSSSSGRDRAGGAAAHAGGFANSGKAAVQRGAFGGLRRWLRPAQGRGALGAGIIQDRPAAAPAVPVRPAARWTASGRSAAGANRRRASCSPWLPPFRPRTFLRPTRPPPGSPSASAPGSWPPSRGRSDAGSPARQSGPARRLPRSVVRLGNNGGFDMHHERRQAGRAAQQHRPADCDGATDR